MKVPVGPGLGTQESSSASEEVKSNSEKTLEVPSPESSTQLRGME